VVPQGETVIHEGQALVFPAGAAVPGVRGGAALGGGEWQRPLLDPGTDGYPLLSTWAVLLATMLGTMGLPHVLMRFNTSPGGRAARRTAAITVALLSVFYLFPGIYGVLGRVLVPELYLSGTTDTVVVALPSRVDTGWPGMLFTALLTAGAFAAFLATSLGLLLVVSGAIAHDLLPGGLRRMRFTVVIAAAVTVLLALHSTGLDAGVLVTWAFTVAASTFSPLLVLGIWWRGLTSAGAISGVLTGLLATSGSILFALFGPPLHGWLAILVGQPAPWTVPLAFAVMALISRRGRPPRWSNVAMLRLHLDEERPFPPVRSTRLADRSSTVRRKARHLNG
jgi:Na+(H+)/acetate symporter ActP